MYYLLFLFLGVWLGYKLKTLVEFLNMLKLKNYVEYYVNKMEHSNYRVVNFNKKDSLVMEEDK